MKTAKNTVAALTLLLIALLLQACVAEGGASSTVSENGFCLELDSFNSTASEDFDLNAGDAVLISSDIKSGNAVISVIAENGEVVYTGRTPLPEKFTVNIQSGGRYTFYVKGTSATGNVSFEIQRRSNS